MDPDATPHEVLLHVDVNLDGLLGLLQRDIRRISSLVAIGIQSPVSIDDAALATRSDAVDFRFGKQLPWSDAEEARLDYREWVFANGLRDLIEAVSSFVESVRQVLACWSLGERQAAGEPLTGADWHAEIHQAAKRFNEFGLPLKIKHLRKTFDMGVGDELDEQVYSINAARNCLVHRRGVVAEKDIGTEGALTVQWRRLAITLRDEDGERPLVLGAVLEKAATVAIRTEVAFKRFELGARVVFSESDFAEICWSMYLYSVAWGDALSKRGLARGFIQESQPAGR